MTPEQKAAILERLESRYIPNYYVSDVRDLLTALDQCEQERDELKTVAYLIQEQLTEAHRLIGTWREAHRILEREHEPNDYLECADLLAKAIGEDGPPTAA